MIRSRQGQAMAEFLVIVAVLALALFLPYVEGQSVASHLARALMDYLRTRSFLISIL